MTETAYHRTYPPLTMTGGAFFPSVHFEARKEVFIKAGARKAWHLDERKKLIPVVIRIRKGQDFASQATGWELAYSKLVSLKNKADPVVTKDGDVVGHFGWFQGHSEILVPVGTPELHTANVNTLLEKNVPIYVTRDNPMASYYTPLGVSDQSYQFITTPDGLVLAQTGYRNRDGAESVFITPLDLIAVAKLVVHLGKAGGRMVVNAFTRKGGERTVGYGVSREAAAQAAKSTTADSAANASKKIKPVNGKVNVGGGHETPNMTNLNPINPVSGGPSRGIPNHVKAPMEDMANVFEDASVEFMTSSRLRFIDVDWSAATKAAAKAMKPGGKVEMNIWTFADDQVAQLKTAFTNAGFKNVDVKIYGVGKGASSTGFGPGTILTATR